MSWLRLDADYLDDARIWDAGWLAEAVCLLPSTREHAAGLK